MADHLYAQRFSKNSQNYNKNLCFLWIFMFTQRKKNN